MVLEPVKSNSADFTKTLKNHLFLFVFSGFGQVWERQVGPSWLQVGPSWLQVGLGRGWVGSSWPGSHLGRLQVGLGLGWVGSSWPGSALGRPKLGGF